MLLEFFMQTPKLNTEDIKIIAKSIFLQNHNKKEVIVWIKFYVLTSTGTNKTLVCSY